VRGTYRTNMAHVSPGPSVFSTAGAVRIHELVHGAPNNTSIPFYSHLRMNQATFNILGRMGLTTKYGDGTFAPTFNNGDGTNYGGRYMDDICHQ
jgi:hypothetical protein